MKKEYDIVFIKTFILLNFLILFVNIQHDTEIQKSSNKPEWNQDFVFKIHYPPLIRCLKIELIKESFINEVIATEYIHLDEISDPHTVKNNEDELSFGPLWIYLYDEPYILAKQKVFKVNYQDLETDNSRKAITCKSCERLKEKHPNYNKDSSACFYKKGRVKNVSLRDFNGKCSKYIGRIKIQIMSEYKQAKPETVNEKDKDEDEGNYLLFSKINAANLIHPKYKKRKISFKITVGSSLLAECSNNVNEGYYSNYTNENSIYIHFENHQPIIFELKFLVDSFEILRMKKNNFLKRKIKEMVC